MSGGVGQLVMSGPLVLAVPVAAAAGAITFASPCCLPLLPGYLSYVSGVSGEELEMGLRRRRVLAGTLLFMLGFAFATLAAGLATTMPTWLALLITTGILLGLAGLLGILARAKIRKGTPPVPEQAIEEAKRTSEVLKSDGTA